MKWGSIVGISFVVICIILFEWSKIGKGKKKEKIAFISLSFLGWLLAILLLLFPDMPGPTQLVDGLFKPLGKWLEK